MVTAMNILTPPTSFIFKNQKANSQKQGGGKKKVHLQASSKRPQTSFESKR